MGLGFGPDAASGVLAHAARQVRERGLDRFPIVDADAHHFEARDFFREMAQYIENPTIRRRAAFSSRRQGPGFSLVGGTFGNQNVAGRIDRPGYSGPDPSAPRAAGVPGAVAEFRHAMDQMGIDYAVMFPTSLLSLGIHPEPEVEVEVERAYARWMTEMVLPCDPRIITMLPLPFSDPDACLDLIERFGGCRGVVGFMVTSVRGEPVHHKRYMKVYRALEERRLPLGFHSAHDWRHPALAQFNRFLSVHALGFPLYNIIHLMNVVVNGIPERFPDLRFIWIEGGVAWIPFLMHRLDNEYLMRSSDAPQLNRLPSEYMQRFYYTTQPLEYTPRLGDRLREVFEMVGGATQFLYASDYPHNDFDVPARIYDLPFLSDAERRRILGGNALQVFRLPAPSAHAASAL
jgi:predicted TIM-barrel fold metal-dependent hydrolase